MTRRRYLRMLHFAIFSVAPALQFPYPYRDIQTALSAEAGAVAEFDFAHYENMINDGLAERSRLANTASAKFSLYHNRQNPF